MYNNVIVFRGVSHIYVRTHVLSYYNRVTFIVVKCIVIYNVRVYRYTYVFYYHFTRRSPGSSPKRNLLRPGVKLAHLTPTYIRSHTMACAQWTAGRESGVKGKKGSEEMSRDAFVALRTANLSGKLSRGRRAIYISTHT